LSALHSKQNKTFFFSFSKKEKEQDKMMQMVKNGSILRFQCSNMVRILYGIACYCMAGNNTFVQSAPITNLTLQ
jgi:hypothetical protein